MPEVEAIRQGRTVSLIRGFKLLQPVPLIGGERACYYVSKGSAGWSADDFFDPQWARTFSGQSEGCCSLIAVPYGHYRLGDKEVVGELAEELTPWRGSALRAWAAQRRAALWLTVFRAYEIDPVDVEEQRGVGLQKVKPFRARNMRSVLSDGAWSERVQSVAQAVRLRAGNAPPAEGVKEPVDAAELSAKIGYMPAEIDRWQRLLRRKKHLVFSGAPGTGKTYVARHFARWVAGQSRGAVETVQFNPATAYEDFIQGLRPRKRQGRTDYEYADGTFVQFCNMARANPDSHHVFFIDELNRAPIARVFGELLYLLEYRNESVRLSSSGQAFSVPPNVLVVATMNGADRSIAAVDQALVRRFAFVRLNPNVTILAQALRKWGLSPQPLVSLVEEINALIDGEDRLLGISFFLQDGANLPAVLEDIWRSEVEPYLEEALYELPEAVERYCWEGVKDRLAELGQGE